MNDESAIERAMLSDAVVRLMRENKSIIELLMNHRDKLVMLLGYEDYTIFTHYISNINKSFEPIIAILNKTNQSTSN